MVYKLKFSQEMLSSPKAACRARAFDLILNLGVHAQLLEPIITDNASTMEEEYSQESYLDSESKLAPQGNMKTDAIKMGTSSAIYNFESWILNILYETLLLLVQVKLGFKSHWAGLVLDIPSCFRYHPKKNFLCTIYLLIYAVFLFEVLMLGLRS